MNLEDKKISKKATSTKETNAVATDNVGNYEKHSFFIKKSAAAKALLLKAGLPTQLTRKAKI